MSVSSRSQALDRTAPCLPILPATPERHTHDYVRHGTTSLFAAYDLASGSVIAQHYRRHRHQEFLRFLKLIVVAVPSDLDLHLVLGSYVTRKTPAIKDWLIKHPCFHLHFAPASSSWLNLVERWFAELTNRKLRRSAHRSVTGLEAGIRKWINEWEQGPQAIRLDQARRRHPGNPRRLPPASLRLSAVTGHANEVRRDRPRRQPGRARQRILAPRRSQERPGYQISVRGCGLSRGSGPDSA
jgi:transposase